LKQKSEALAEKAGEAYANAQKAVQESIDESNTNSNSNIYNDPNNFDESAIAPPTDDGVGVGAGAGVGDVTASAVRGESLSQNGNGLLSETTTTDEPGSVTKKHIASNIANMTEGLKGISFRGKFPEKEIVVTDLMLVLASLFDFDPKAKKQHDMVESLELEGITTFRAFCLMSEEDIPTLRKKGDVPISKNSVRMLTYLKRFTMYNINNNVENAKDPELYTRDAFDAFVDDLQLGRKTHLSVEAVAVDTAAEEEDGDGKSSKRGNNIRQSITGFASRLKPGARTEDGSVADILLKAKAKVLMMKKSKGGGGGGDAEPPSDEVSVDGGGSVVSELEPGTVADNEGAIEEMKKNVDDLASKLQKTTTETAGKTREEVQKLMLPLLSNLKKSQDRFGALIEARKKKMAEKRAEKEAAGEGAGAADGEENNDETNNDDETDDKQYKHLFDDDTSKLKNLLSNAEKATMKAFHDAEKVARQAARKAGILDNNSSSNGAADVDADGPVSENGAESVRV